VKVQPVPFSDCEIVPLAADLIACDHCGIVAVDTPRFGWQRWTDEAGTVRHHCPQQAEYNEWVRNSLVHNVAPESAIEYEQWDDHPTDEQPEMTVDSDYAATMHDIDKHHKAQQDAAKAAAVGYATEPQHESATAATDASFLKPSTEAQYAAESTPPVELSGPLIVPDNPIFAPVNKIDLGDDPDGDASVDPRDT
jgi:hypothetical protein